MDTNGGHVRIRCRVAACPEARAGRSFYLINAYIRRNLRPIAGLGKTGWEEAGEA